MFRRRRLSLREREAVEAQQAHMEARAQAAREIQAMRTARERDQLLVREYVQVLFEERDEEQLELRSGGLAYLAKIFEDLGPEAARRLHDHEYLYSGRLDLEAARSAQHQAGVIEHWDGCAL